MTRISDLAPHPFTRVCAGDRFLIEQWCVDGNLVLAAAFVFFVACVIGWVVKETRS